MLEDLYERWVEHQKLRLFLGVIVLFFVSMGMSCQELRYLTFGKTIDATIITNRVDTLGKEDDRLIQKRVLGYHYLDGEKAWTQYVDVPLNWTPAAPTIKIQYIPGRETSRLYGRTNMFWVWVFFGSLVLAGIGAYIIAREK